jgi:UDPglucose 6-dehydrogenase
LDALAKLSNMLGYKPVMIEATVAINQKQWRKAIQFAERGLSSLSGRGVAILGLAFKPNTDDMRCAVSVPTIKSLLRKGAMVSPLMTRWR